MNGGGCLQSCNLNTLHCDFRFWSSYKFYENLCCQAYGSWHPVGLILPHLGILPLASGCFQNQFKIISKSKSNLHLVLCCSACYASKFYLFSVKGCVQLLFLCCLFLSMLRPYQYQIFLNVGIKLEVVLW